MKEKKSDITEINTIMSATLFNNTFIKKHTTYVYCEPVITDISSANKRIYINQIGNVLDEYISKLETIRSLLWREQESKNEEKIYKLEMKELKYIRKTLALLYNNSEEILKLKYYYDEFEDSYGYLIEKDANSLYFLPINYISKMYEKLEYNCFCYKKKYETKKLPIFKNLLKKSQKNFKLIKEVVDRFGLEINTEAPESYCV